ncbi:MAG: phosphoribosylanthranilate isomerase [Burkholderiales bacterium]
MRTRIKICGITRVQDARAAAQGGADAIGLVFYPSSPRYLSIERAVELRDTLPPFIQTVALFVNPDAPQVAQVLQRVRPALLQFHGEETPEFCGQFGVPFVKAYRVRGGMEDQKRGQKRPGSDALEYLRPFSRAAAWLFDSHVPEYGGVGEGFDLSLMPVVKEKPVILSGGLSAANVAEAIRRVRPWGVDVSSGVESAKGVKDAARIAAFIAEVRDADV